MQQILPSWSSRASAEVTAVLGCLFAYFDYFVVQNPIRVHPCHPWLSRSLFPSLGHVKNFRFHPLRRIQRPQISQRSSPAGHHYRGGLGKAISYISWFKIRSVSI